MASPALRVEGTGLFLPLEFPRGLTPVHGLHQIQPKHLRGRLSPSEASFPVHYADGTVEAGRAGDVSRSTSGTTVLRGCHSWSGRPRAESAGRVSKDLEGEHLLRPEPTRSLSGGSWSHAESRVPFTPRAGARHVRGGDEMAPTPHSKWAGKRGRPRGPTGALGPFQVREAHSLTPLLGWAHGKGGSRRPQL